MPSLNASDLPDAGERSPFGLSEMRARLDTFLDAYSAVGVPVHFAPSAVIAIIVDRLTMWVVFVGGALYAWVHGRIGAGDFVMTTTLTSSLLQTAYDLGQRIPEFYDQIGSARESIDTLIVPANVTDMPGAPALGVTQGSIHLERIAFAYELTSGDQQRRLRNVVKDFELLIPAGQRVGLAGPSGAGKTTLMGLLMRMHDVGEGAIRIDGQDIRHVTQQSLRQAIALIPQDTTLFHRNLRENIRMGVPMPARPVRTPREPSRNA